LAKASHYYARFNKRFAATSLAGFLLLFLRLKIVYKIRIIPPASFAIRATFGAGGRIVDMLYRTDRQSSKVACVEALAVDVDADSLSQLTALPDRSKIYFPPVDLTSPRALPDPLQQQPLMLVR
jgi:hypothetical protein